MEIPDPSEYSSSLRNKILELRELVHDNIVELAEHHQHSHHSRAAGVNRMYSSTMPQRESLTLDGHEGSINSVPENQHCDTGQCTHQSGAPSADRGERSGSINKLGSSLFHHEEGPAKPTPEDLLELQDDSWTVGLVTTYPSNGGDSHEGLQEPSLVPQCLQH